MYFFSIDTNGNNETCSFITEFLGTLPCSYAQLCGCSYPGNWSFCLIFLPGVRVTATLFTPLPPLSPYSLSLLDSGLHHCCQGQVNTRQRPSTLMWGSCPGWSPSSACLLALPRVSSFCLWTVRCGFLDSLLVPVSLALDPSSGSFHHWLPWVDICHLSGPGGLAPASLGQCPGLVIYSP